MPLIPVRYVTVSTETLPYNRVIARIDRYIGNQPGHPRRYEMTISSQRRMSQVLSNHLCMIEIEGTVDICARIEKRQKAYRP